MYTVLVSTAAILAFTASQVAAGGQSCKCGPDDACWPSATAWSNLNATVSGKLILNIPPALVCYPGPAYNSDACTTVDNEWSNQTFQTNNPIGLSYPLDLPCPPVNASAGQIPGTCSIGDLPRYTVNATCAADISASILFAKLHNIRLVIKDTGHDILGRSTGYGSLEVWTRHVRTGITYQEKYKPSDGCTKSTWTGSAFVIGGGYTWSDVYPLAQSKNVVVVGGGTPSVGCLGGWMQGGGHGPASHDYGLGADQVLEATVVLADGSVVTANPCQNPRLFFAIRGGGGGTYGVVVSTTIKAWPNPAVITQHLAIASLSSDSSPLLEAIAIVWAGYPDLNDAGFSGYGTWAVNFPVPLFGDVTTGFVHGISMFGKSLAEAQAAFAPVLAQLEKYNGTSLFISVSYVSYSTYWDFYQHESGVEPPVGYPGVLGSRLFDRAALTQNSTGFLAMLKVIQGLPGQGISNNFELVSGGQVFKDADDPYSGVNPAWRTSYMNNIVAWGLPPTANASELQAAAHDITYTKVPAMNAQAPNTGTYMNEADRFDPDFAKDFYGTHHAELFAIKQYYDPYGVFYCPTCVGSALWTEQPNGKLCHV